MPATRSDEIDHYLNSIARRLREEVLNTKSKLSRYLLNSLDLLSPEEFRIVSDPPDAHLEETPLTVACRRRLFPVVKYLCQKVSPDLSRLRCVNPFEPTSSKAPLLWIAVDQNHRPMVEWLLDHGANINEVNNFGCTPVSHACFQGMEEMVSFLIKNGANLNIPDCFGTTCLMNSIANVALCKMLLKEGADLYTRDCNRLTVLNHAVERNQIKTVQFLIFNEENSFKIDPRDAYGLLIPAILNSPELAHLLSFLYANLSPGETANMYELEGCVLNDIRSSTRCWLRAAKIRRRYNESKVVNSPKAVFEHRTECVTSKQIRSLRTVNHFMYQSLMVLIRILGSAHYYIVHALLTYLRQDAGGPRSSAFNRFLFLLLETEIERYGFLSESATGATWLFMKYFGLALEDAIVLGSLDFEILFETLQLFGTRVLANHVDCRQFPKDVQDAFDWNLKFVLFLILFTFNLRSNSEEDNRLRRYIHEQLLVCGEEDGQLRTASRERTLLHLAVTNFSISESLQVTSFWSRIQRVQIFPNVNLIKLLLDCGAPINLADVDGASPLFVAVSAKNFNMEVVELLKSRSGHLEMVGSNGKIVVDVRNRLPPETMKLLDLPRVPSLRCLCALALTSAGVSDDSIPQGLKKFVKIHRR